MGRGDSRRTLKMRRRVAQRKQKARIKHRVQAAKNTSTGAKKTKKSK